MLASSANFLVFLRDSPPPPDGRRHKKKKNFNIPNFLNPKNLANSQSKHRLPVIRPIPTLDSGEFYRAMKCDDVLISGRSRIH